MPKLNKYLKKDAPQPLEVMTLVMMSSKVIEKVREVGKRGFIRFLRRCLEGSLLRLERIRSDRLGYLQLVA